MRDVAVRNTNTYKSGVFAGERLEDTRVRDQKTYISSVFRGAIVNKCSRVKLEPAPAGTEKLFGTDQVDYEKSSVNPMLEKAAPASEKKRAQVQQVSAKEQMKREYYTEAA